MQPPDMPESLPEDRPEPASPADRLAVSARGWHRIQLAVLGFIGLCGVLWSSGESSAPYGIGWAATALVVISLGLAGVAIYLVGTVAYPFYGGSPEAAHLESARLANDTRRLRAGIKITYVAVGVLVVATLAGWWPQSAQANTVEALGAAGETWCGDLVDGPPRAITLDTEGGRVAVPLDSIDVLRPVSGC